MRTQAVSGRAGELKTDWTEPRPPASMGIVASWLFDRGRCGTTRQSRACALTDVASDPDAPAADRSGVRGRRQAPRSCPSRDSSFAAQARRRAVYGVAWQDRAYGWG